MARGVTDGRSASAAMLLTLLASAASAQGTAPVETTPAPMTAAPTPPPAVAPPGLPPDLSRPLPAPAIPAIPSAPSNQVTLSAALLHYEEDARRWIATGSVEVRFRQYILRGDSGDYDEASETATLRGNVTLDTGQNVINGGPDAELTFHFPDRTWAFSRATTELKPQGLLEPVYVSAGALTGTRQRLTLRDVRVTTCAPERPQYELSAREVTLVPDVRLIARGATAYLFGHRLATLPAVVLPIRREATDRPPIVPVVGQSTEEGAYVKTSINYAAGASQTGAFRVDAMQRQGLGLGVTHDYTFGGASGEAALYGVGGPNGRNLSANLRHRQRLLGFDANVQGELRRNSYLYLPGTTSRNATVTLGRARGASDTQIALRYDNTRAGAFPYENLTSNLAQSYRYSPRGTARLNLDFTRQSAVSATSKELATRVDVTHAFPAVDVQFAANRITSFGETPGLVFRPVQRLPEVLLRSDARRLGLTQSKTAPVSFLLSSGRFEANNKKGDRQQFQLDVPSRAMRVGGARLDYGGGFRQAVYASDAKLYTLNANARLTQPLGRKSDLALAYTVQDPHGYTPFQFDRPFPYSSLTGSLRLGDMRGLEVRVGTGYDFRNRITPWRDLLGFVLIQPGPAFRLATNVAVNVNGRDPGQKSAFRYVNSALRLRFGAFHFDGEARYLPSTGRFGRLLGNLATPVGRRWTVRSLAGTSSGQHYRRLMVVRDFGCLEGYVAAVDDRGWRTERGVRVMLRIKAFPFAEPFSSGMSGESLDIGAPDVTYGGIASGPLSETPPSLF